MRKRLPLPWHLRADCPPLRLAETSALYVSCGKIRWDGDGQLALSLKIRAEIFPKCHVDQENAELQDLRMPFGHTQLELGEPSTLQMVGR